MNDDLVRQGIEAAEAIVALAESVLHGGQEVDETRTEELIRRARLFGGSRPPAPLVDAQRSLANAAQALSDAARFERDRKRSRSPDGQKRNWLARNMALSTAKLNAAMAGMQLTSRSQAETDQLHELSDAVTDLSAGVRETSEQVAHPRTPMQEEPEERQPPTSAGSAFGINLKQPHAPQARRPPGGGGRQRRRRRSSRSDSGPGGGPGGGKFRGGPHRKR